MALVAYQQQVQRLLNDESAQFFNIADLTTYINYARDDVARQSECLIQTVELALSNGVRAYALGDLTPPTGYLNPINVRSISQVNEDSSTTVLEVRPWQWGVNYWFNGAYSFATAAALKGWTQQTQGATGYISVYPLPDGALNINVEASWYPEVLVTDSTPEVIPSPWTSCVPYYATYLALAQAQRLQDAGQMLQLYQRQLKSARMGVTPEWLPTNFPSPKSLQGMVDETLSGLGQRAQPAKQGEGSV